MRLKFTLLLTFFSIILLTNAQPLDYESVKKKKKGKFTEYTANNGTIFKVGDTISIGRPYGYGDFRHIAIKTGPTSGVFSPATPKDTDVDVVILNIKAKSAKAYIYTSKRPDKIYHFLIEVEASIELGELKTDVLNSDQALLKLKSWKDKLEVEIISQEEYDKKKEELIKFIK